METVRYSKKIEDIEKAAKVIFQGGLIGFPTETVYGLGANALDEKAVKKIYKAKGRPSDNPMIVHISTLDDIYMLGDNISRDAIILGKSFWPGPLTMVIKANHLVPKVTTGGLDTVGVRLPDNEIARKLIKASKCPIAAPSANSSGKPSPTKAAHVLEDLDGKIDGIILGDDCQIGIESTVVDMTGENPIILRPGKITPREIEEVLGKKVFLDPTLNENPKDKIDFSPKAPGMKYKHYAPKAEMVIYLGEESLVREKIETETALLEKQGKKVKTIVYGDDDLEHALNSFFSDLREADEEKVDIILAKGYTKGDLAFSIMNRMLKSAGYNVVCL